MLQPSLDPRRLRVASVMPRIGWSSAASASMVVMPAASSFFTCPRVMLATLNRLSSDCQTSSQWSAQRQRSQSEHGTGRVGYRICDESFKPRPGLPRVGREIRQPQSCALSITQFDMGVFGSDPLHLGQQVRVEHQLQDMFRMRATFELGVGNFVTERSESGRPFDPFEKIRPAAPVARQEEPPEILHPAHSPSASRVASASSGKGPYVRSRSRAVQRT